MADLIQNIYNFIISNISILWATLFIIFIIILFNYIVRSIKRTLLAHAKSKQQVSNIKILMRMVNVGFSLIVILFAFLTYVGSWTSLGIVAGLLTAALGFALQKPITGIAAWIMVIVKRPFNIGDRIKIGEVKGEVYDISLTHIHIDEVGGLINSEELSGRNIMVPNYLLFEQNIINYTMLNDFILGEVVVDITFDSNLDKALKIVEKITLDNVKEYIQSAKKEPKIRVSMDPGGIRVKSRFFVPVKAIQRVSSDITKEILYSFKKQKDIKFASTYPPKG